MKGIHNAGGILQIVLAASGDKVRGKLTHHDPYTITLSVDGENVVYFKHAIESFKQVQVH
ncbi:RNA chaperone Hfq [Oxalobacter sp. OttesenSCG-928-P03]|nr:RNA chaperone Hfq [Oxalobacter sp. OttesenSCG-928-P03]